PIQIFMFLYLTDAEPTLRPRSHFLRSGHSLLRSFHRERRCGKMTWKVSEMTPIRVLLVDDHDVARRGIRSVLSSDSNLDVVGETSDGEDAVKKAGELHPAIVLLDISLPGISG